MMGRAAALLVRLYQVTLSRLLPPGRCRFHPTCSEYAVQALRANGLVRGGAQAAWRLLRCGPWSAGGVDDVRVRARRADRVATGASSAGGIRARAHAGQTRIRARG